MDEKQFSSIQFSSVQDGIYALGKARMYSTPYLGSSHNVALETVPMLVCIDDGRGAKDEINVPIALSAFRDKRRWPFLVLEGGAVDKRAQPICTVP